MFSSCVYGICEAFRSTEMSKEDDVNHEKQQLHHKNHSLPSRHQMDERRLWRSHPCNTFMGWISHTFVNDGQYFSLPMATSARIDIGLWTTQLLGWFVGWNLSRSSLYLRVFTEHLYHALFSLISADIELFTCSKPKRHIWLDNTFFRPCGNIDFLPYMVVPC
jgi:hypothetical protein